MGRTLIVNLGWLMIIRVCTSLMHFLSTTSASSTLMLRTKTPGQGKMIHKGGNTHERSDKDKESETGQERRSRRNLLNVVW